MLPLGKGEVEGDGTEQKCNSRFKTIQKSVQISVISGLKQSQKSVQISVISGLKIRVIFADKRGKCTQKIRF